jgi:hypothetical protein
MAEAFAWIAGPASGCVDAVIAKVMEVVKSDEDASGWNNAAVPV